MNKIIQFLRGFKLTYILYNFLHRKELKHNQDAYKNADFKKPLFWTLSSEDFTELENPSPWLDQSDALEKLKTHPKYVEFSPVLQEKLVGWVESGYIILDNFFSLDQVQQANADIERLLKTGKIEQLANGKIMFAFKKSAILHDMAANSELIALLEFILGKEIIPFQTINFIHGSQQRAHSDSIHMTTHPQGYMLASWIALEDTDADNGPLLYYPGSHRLPYLMNKDYDHKSSFLTVDSNYTGYENKVEEVLTHKDFPMHTLHVKAGSLLIWHANLIHGGSAINDPKRTRKSMVTHYYAKDVIKYHEITQRPSLLTP
jgi:ectoine hydroxylase